MQRPPETVARKMVPRWRSLKVTPSAELVSANRTAQRRSILVDEVRAEWLERPSLESAADLIAAAVLAGSTRESDEAADLLADSEASLSPGIAHLLRAYRKEEGELAAKFGSGVPSDRTQRYSAIASIKASIRRYPRNPLNYVELARHYTSLGQVHSAERALNYALGMAPINRYVLRSAVRFFIHEGNLERAAAIISRAPPNDPWLAACKITVAQLIGRDHPGLKAAQRLLDNNSPSQVTELAAAVATSELGAGSIKRAKKLFRQSADDPNDNSVAQLRWANETAGVQFDPSLLKVDLSYEARTGQLTLDKQWRAAAQNARLWLIDEPFSHRAAYTGTFLAAEMAADYHLAVEIAELGLVAAPDSAHLMNDYAYALASLGRLGEAESWILKARSSNPGNSTQICLTATEGFIRYRRGNRVGGSEKYQEAFEAAVEANARELIQRGMLHWIYEEVRAGAEMPEDARRNVVETFSDESRLEVGVSDIFNLHLRPLLEAPNPSPSSAESDRGDVKSRALSQLDRIGKPPPIRVSGPRPVAPIE